MMEIRKLHSILRILNFLWWKGEKSRTGVSKMGLIDPLKVGSK